MTLRKWMIIGFVATVFIPVALPVYAFNESYRMVNAQTTLLTESIEHAEIIYAESCVVCHGVDGRGIGAYPGLDNEGVQDMAYSDLFKIIERGRYNTAMAAWGRVLSPSFLALLHEELKRRGAR